jgi:ectoine hydroxylase-related dioxygenase (phytanoyl-CoA dioxygenase family)
VRVRGLTAHERYFFDVNGYLVIEGVLRPDEARRLHDVISARRVATPAGSISSQRIDADFLLWDQGFRALLDHPAVLARLRDLLGDHLRLDHAYGIVMAPETSGLGLHGGGTPWDPSQYYYAHRDGRIYNGLTTVTWSLVDAGPSHGGFGCIPGSHKAAERLPGNVPAGWVKEIPMPAGSVLIFTEALTHCTLPWKAPYERRAVLFKYAPGHLAWGRHADVSAALRPLLTERQRRLFQPPAVAPHEPVL